MIVTRSCHFRTKDTKNFNSAQDSSPRSRWGSSQLSPKVPRVDFREEKENERNRKVRKKEKNKGKKKRREKKEKIRKGNRKKGEKRGLSPAMAV